MANVKLVFLMLYVKLVAIGVVVLLTGCAGTEGPPGLPGAPSLEPVPILPITSPDATMTELTLINAQREAQGQEDLIQGLSCTLYTVPQTTIAIIGATLTNVGTFRYIGEFNIPNESTSVGLSLLPAPLQLIYQNWYVVKCTGTIIIGESAWYSFATSSDDGSNLYINGTLVVNNDGLHGVQTVTSAKFLAVGGYSFELDYLQGNGNQALVVNMDGLVLPQEMLVH